MLRKGISGRKIATFVQVAIASFVLAAFALYYFRISPLAILRQNNDGLDLGSMTVPADATLSHKNITSYVRSILEPSSISNTTSISKFDCPNINHSRYNYLRSQGPYFLALDLRNCLPILPQLLSSIIETIRFLGPENCALSIVEGNSPDGTADVLAALEPLLKSHFPGGGGLRTHFLLHQDNINPVAEGADRFSTLAQLRNLALRPLVEDPTTRYTTDEATVLFINDVALCPDDILELAHQRVQQDADMACAMDWIDGHLPNPLFYDSFIARSMSGNLFFDIPTHPLSWDKASDLFWDEPIAKKRYAENHPFQVFACWNGMVAFTAQPIVKGEILFRGAREEEGECRTGEPTLFCKDLWYKGYGKIMVVPTVNLEYSVEKGRKIKELKGFASEVAVRVEGEEEEAEKIEWLPPPDMVKCMPTFQEQTWRSWNETFA